MTDTPSGGERFGEERLLDALPDAPAEPARDDRRRAERRCVNSRSATSVDDRAMLALRLVGVGEEPEHHSAADEPKVSVT